MHNTRQQLIDSHVHLYAGHDLVNLSWTADLPDGHLLKQQRSVADYMQATIAETKLTGFIFVETDRKSGVADTEWHHALEEVAYVSRIANNEVEGFANLLLGFVPWAPICGGPEILARYVANVKEKTGNTSTFALVKGFRDLMQFKPRGTMTDPLVVSSIKWLAQEGFTFDLTIDCHSAGLWQIQEACQMLTLAHEDGHKPRIIIDHFGKPNLTIPEHEIPAHEEFRCWKNCIQALASYPNIFMKLSGFLSELPEPAHGDSASLYCLLKRTRPWFQVVLAEFGAKRVMFGSDWPVCTVHGPGDQSWQYWREYVEELLKTLSAEEQRWIKSQTAVAAYGLSIAPCSSL